MKLESIIEETLKQIRQRGAKFGEVLILKNTFSLRRVVDGEVYQPTASENLTIIFSFIVDNKRITASTSSMKNLDDEIEKAFAKARYLPAFGKVFLPDGKFPDATLPLEMTFDSETAELNDERAIEVIKQINDIIEPEDFIFDGVVSQGVGEFVLGNALGTFQKYIGTNARLEIFGFDPRDRSISAYRTVAGKSLRKFPVQELAQDVVKKCAIQRNYLKKNSGQRINPFEFAGKSAPWRFDVIMEPSCLTGMLAIFSGQAQAWNGKAYHDGVSFFSGKLGKKVMGDNITILDDSLHPDGIPMPFDFEGFPKKKLTLVEKGIARNVVYDTALAKEHGVVSTGHALLPYLRHMGTLPLHLVVDGKNDSVEDMIRASKRPTIWITTLHYIRSTHNQDGRETGNTLHGVFLVKDGEVVGPTLQLRFDESVPEALSRVTHIGKSLPTLSMETEDTPYIVPAIRVEDFRFVSVADRSM